jgi:hypothetical protein
MRTIPAVLLTALLGAGTLAAPTAEAGCFNLCDLELQQLEIQPASECLSAAFEYDSCNCAAEITLSNGCRAEMALADPGPFSLYSCRAIGSESWDFEAECDPLPADWELRLGADLDEQAGAGPHNMAFDVSLDGQRHTVSATFEAKFKDAGCLCASAPAGQSAALLGLLAALCWLRRKR